MSTPTLALDSQIDSLLNRLNAGKIFPYSHLMVFDRHHLLANKTIGNAELSGSQAYDGKGVFRYFSMTKPIVSVLALKILQEKGLNVDEPIANWLPFFESMSWYRAPGDSPKQCQEPIRIRHLLSHTSGMSYDYYQLTPQELKYKELGIDVTDHSITLLELSKRLAQADLHYEPGQGWSYGFSTDVLGAVLEVIGGQDLRSLLKSKILDPLNMQHTDFHYDQSSGRSLVPLYARLSEMNESFRASFPPLEEYQDLGLALIDESKTSEKRNAPTLFSAGGGLLGTLEDYLKFAQLCLNNGEGLISQNDFRSMLANQLDGDIEKNRLPTHDPYVKEGYGFGLGFGLDLSRSQGEELAFWSGAGNSFILLDFRNQLGLLFETQVFPFGYYDLFSDLKDLLTSLPSA